MHSFWSQSCFPPESGLSGPQNSMPTPGAGSRQHSPQTPIGNSGQTGHAGPLTLGVLEALVAALLQRLFTAAPLPRHRKATTLLGVRHALVVRSANPVDGGCHALVPAVSAVHVVDVHAADLCQHASGSPREGKQERDCSRRARRNRDRITLT